ncbi:MAG: PDZ domain-containing protein [Pirellulaceae bacterium]|nr:PDZ domain-containing protein [Pirellulaceae bacterium]
MKRFSSWLMGAVIGICGTCSLEASPQSSIAATPTESQETDEPSQAQPSGGQQPASQEVDDKASSNTQLPNKAFSNISSKMKWTGTQPPSIWLGVGLKEVTGDLATYLGSSEGVLIESVFPDSPAATAQLQAGDVVIAFDGTKILGPADFVSALRTLGDRHTGKTEPVEQADKADKADSQNASPTYPPVRLTIMRRGQEMTIPVTPAARPEPLKLAEVNELEASQQGADLLYFGRPSKLSFNFNLPTHESLNKAVIISRERVGESTEVRVMRQGDGPIRITVKDKDGEREISEAEVDQLPENARSAVQRILKSLKSQATQPAKKNPQPEQSDANVSKPEGQARIQDDQQTQDAVREQIQKALKQVGGANIQIEANLVLTDALKQLSEAANVIVIEPAVLQEAGQVAQRYRQMADKWAHYGVQQAQAFASLPEQVKQLHQQIDDLKKQVEQLQAELKSKSK